jgi:hypothetical protein
MHTDNEAIATVVISLSDYGTEYRGGLYVAAGGDTKRVLAMSRGDGVLHQTDVMHGVDLGDKDSERWSIILWIRDSFECAQHNAEWHRECAEAGNPICQYLHSLATIDRTRSDMGGPAVVARSVEWIQRSASGGYIPAVAQLAAVRSGNLPPPEALDLLRKTIASISRNAAPPAWLLYQLAQLLLQAGESEAEAVACFEAAATMGDYQAMYNLGVAHLYGQGVARADPQLAAEWFEASGLPEGLHAVSLYHQSNGRVANARYYADHAAALGFGRPWRDIARQRSNVKLHSAWRPRGGGPAPPQW